MQKKHIGTLVRALAIDALTHILTRRIHFDTALSKLFKNYEGLRRIDKAFAYELVLGSLRWLSKMDWIMSHVVERPFVSLDPRVANALRIGAYQIYYMDRVPNRAAVSETVEAVKSVGAQNAASLVNAVLRRISKKSEYFAKPDKDKNPIEYFSMQYAHPSWMIARWLSRFESKRLAFLLSANNQTPTFTLKIIESNPLPSNDDIPSYLLKHCKIHSEWRPLKGALRVSSLPHFETCDAYKAGSYIVQDESAQLVSSLVSLKKNDKFLDACAAPGGKTIHIWQGCPNEKNITVCDFSKKRLKILEENFKRVGLDGVEILHGDVVEKVAQRQFDKILLDAPCSGFGVMRRHPEIKWLKNLNDIQNAAKEQKRLLNGLVGSLKVGGTLIYSVCTIEEEETTQVVKDFLETHPNFEVVSPDPFLHKFYKKYVTQDNDIFIIPGNPDKIDGFYACLLKKIT